MVARKKKLPLSDLVPIEARDVLERVLGDPRQVFRLVVDVGDPKALLVAHGPLEVVHEGPDEVGLERHAVLFHGLFRGGKVALEEVDAEGVLDGLLRGLAVFAGGGDTVFGDGNLSGVVAVV